MPADERSKPVSFESREVERSLALLDRPAVGDESASPGDEPLSTASAPEGPDGGGTTFRPGRAGVTVPWWAIYAAIPAGVVMAAVAFACGVWWRSVTGGP